MMHMELLKRYLTKYRKPFILALVAVALESLCDLLGPTFMAKIIDLGILKNSLPAVYHWGFFMLLFSLIGLVFAISRNYLSSNVSQACGSDLRRDVFSKILHLDVSSFEHLSPGSLITRMTSDVQQVTQAVNGTMRIFVKAPLTTIGSIVLATSINPRMSMVIYTVVILLFSAIALGMRLSYKRFTALQQALDTMNSRVSEYLHSVRLVKAFGTFAHEQQLFEEDNASLESSSIRAQMIITLLSPLLTLIVGLGTVGILMLGSRLFSLSLANAGDISAFTVYIALMLGSILQMTNIFNILIRTKASLRRLEEVFAQPSEEEPSLANPMPKVTELAFSHVGFSYEGKEGVPALQDISFHVKSAQSIAIIGPTGSGKSTIASLLLRFHDPQQGVITLDGFPLSSLDRTDLRRHIAYVSQNPALFRGTVEENLHWGDPSATKAQIDDALAQAQALFVTDGKQAVASGASNLSGGQKQRLALARALLRHSPILLLDDATSALDAITEAKVRSSLLADKEERIIIFITQRRSLARSADLILVLEDGRQMGLGTHAQLLEDCPVYQGIFASQNGWNGHGPD